MATSIAEAIQALSLKYESVGADKVAADADKVAAAHRRAAGATNDVVVAEEKTTRVRESAGRNLARIEREYDRYNTQLRKRAKDERDLALAVQQGITTQARAAELQALIAERHNMAAAAADRHAAATGRLAQAVVGYGRVFAAGIIGGITAGGIDGIARRIQGMVREVATIGDDASRAGLDVKSFQEWAAVAAATRVPIDALADGFKELAIRADEFAVTGKGSAADAFARLGMSPAEVKTRLRDPSALMQELIARTQNLKDVAAGTRLFDELFGGTGGERMVRFLQMADGEIGDIIRSAEEAGAIFDAEMIRKADEMDRRWSVAWRNFEMQAKAGILGVISFLDELGQTMDQLGDQIGNASIFGKVVEAMERAGLLYSDVKLNGANVRASIDAGQITAMEDNVRFLEQHVRHLKAIGEDATKAQMQLVQARAGLTAEIARIGKVGSDVGSPASAPAVAGGQPFDLAADFIRRYREELALSDDARKAAELSEKILADAMRQGAAITREQADELARLTRERDDATKSAAGLTSVLDQLAKREREVIIQGLSPRAAATTRILDEFKEREAALRKFGAEEADIARNTATMNEAIRLSIEHFDKLEAAAGDKGAAKGIREANTAMESFISRADGLLATAFPGEAARREAVELINLLDLYGDKLDDFQRAAVQMRITDQFAAASTGVREWERDTTNSAENIRGLLGDIGQAAAGIFQGAKDSLWDWVDAVVAPIADLPADKVAAMVEAAFNQEKPA